MAHAALKIETAIRERLVSAVHSGSLKAGDRLPSIRRTAREQGVDQRIVARVYHELAAEGLVEVRGKSGVYFAPVLESAPEPMTTGEEWAGRSLHEAWLRQLPLRDARDAVLRATSRTITVAFAESTVDQLEPFCEEMRACLSLESYAVQLEELGSASAREAQLKSSLAAADIIVTTAFHASELKPIADSLGKPLVVLTIHRNAVAAVRRVVQQGPITLLAVEASFGERIKAFVPDAAEAVNVVAIKDGQDVIGVDPAHRIYCTRAARRRLSPTSTVPLLFPTGPMISPQSARQLIQLMVRLNLAG